MRCVNHRSGADASIHRLRSPGPLEWERCSSGHTATPVNWRAVRRLGLGAGPGIAVGRAVLSLRCRGQIKERYQQIAIGRGPGLACAQEDRWRVFADAISPPTRPTRPVRGRGPSRLGRSHPTDESVESPLNTRTGWATRGIAGLAGMQAIPAREVERKGCVPRLIDYKPCAGLQPFLSSFVREWLGEEGPCLQSCVPFPLAPPLADPSPQGFSPVKVPGALHRMSELDECVGGCTGRVSGGIRGL